MSHKIVVGYDGSESADAALSFAIGVARAQGGSVVIAHVLEWSPYSFLTPTELEERHMRRSEELERAKSALLDPVVAKLSDSGVEVKTALKYGHIAETLCEVAKDEGADQIVIGRTGHSSLSSRLFGSVAGSLAQAGPVPVTIVP
ncbi:universal stress protein [Salibaculum griseiflavum]|uniref:Universal stress protein n=1 Tax=Salibaculum griseiflavum TaxID=1914409 RepID=A0A2V1P1Q0_9RHOB|nr:universal stress protein [Salibaculum griseiflavum]PWG16256.1 universal stress protein [Salibaculum griseiflavum]